MQKKIKFEPYQNKKPFVSPMLEASTSDIRPRKLKTNENAEQRIEPYQNKKPFVSPMLETSRLDRKARRKNNENTEEKKVFKLFVSDYEALIQQILNKKFVVPIPGYIPEYTTKTLGPRRVLVRRFDFLKLQKILFLYFFVF